MGKTSKKKVCFVDGVYSLFKDYFRGQDFEERGLTSTICSRRFTVWIVFKGFHWDRVGIGTVISSSRGVDMSQQMFNSNETG